jgi:hypothetical protein
MKENASLEKALVMVKAASMTLLPSRDFYETHQKLQTMAVLRRSFSESVVSDIVAFWAPRAPRALPDKSNHSVSRINSQDPASSRRWIV